MFGKLEATDIELIEAYMAKYLQEAIYLAQPVALFKAGVLQGALYGYIDEQSLVGLFYFSNKRSLMLHYADEIVLKNLSLLKAFNHYKPKYIKGLKRNMDGFYQVICRTVKGLKEDESFLMAYTGVGPEERLVPYKMLETYSHETKHLFSDMTFFMRVEQHFGKNATTVHDIQKQLLERLKQQQYCLLYDEDMFVAQGFIEEETDHLGIIGGIYVLKTYRRKGLGEAISSKLTHTLRSRDKKAFLFVLRKNTEAIELYEKIGYKAVETYSIFTIED